MRMEYGEIRRTQALARMLPSTGSIAGGTMGLQFRADAKLLVVPAFDRPLVDGRVVRWWIARCVVHRSCRHLIDSGGRLPERSVGRRCAFGSARTHGLSRESCDPASHLSFHLRASVRRHRRTFERSPAGYYVSSVDYGERGGIRPIKRPAPGAGTPPVGSGVQALLRKRAPARLTAKSVDS